VNDRRDLRYVRAILRSSMTFFPCFLTYCTMYDRILLSMYHIDRMSDQADRNCPVFTFNRYPRTRQAQGKADNRRKHNFAEQKGSAPHNDNHQATTVEVDARVAQKGRSVPKRCYGVLGETDFSQRKRSPQPKKGAKIGYSLKQRNKKTSYGTLSKNNVG
jgi:hypothetical protein